jgi:hypothetical protein
MTATETIVVSAIEGNGAARVGSDEIHAVLRELSVRVFI